MLHARGMGDGKEGRIAFEGRRVIVRREGVGHDAFKRGVDVGDRHACVGV